VKQNSLPNIKTWHHFERKTPILRPLYQIMPGKPYAMAHFMFLEHLWWCSMWRWKNIPHIQVFVPYFFPTPPIKLKLGLQIGGRLLMATHLDQWNYLANQKQGAVNKYDLTVFIRLGSESCTFFQGHRSLRVKTLDLTAVHYPRFPVQGHILSTNGDAPSLSSWGSIQWTPKTRFYTINYLKLLTK
jgi:hypothetical protein